MWKKRCFPSHKAQTNSRRNQVARIILIGREINIHNILIKYSWNLNWKKKKIPFVFEKIIPFNFLMVCACGGGIESSFLGPLSIGQGTNFCTIFFKKIYLYIQGEVWVQIK